MASKKKAYMGINPKHEGYCTPMSKSTCTPRRKALAKRLKPGGDLYKGKTMKKKQQGGPLKQLNDMQYARRGKAVGSILEGGRVKYANGGDPPNNIFSTLYPKQSAAFENDLSKYSFIGKSNLDTLIKNNDKKRFIKRVNASSENFNRTNTGGKSQGEVMWDNRNALRNKSVSYSVWLANQKKK